MSGIFISYRRDDSGGHAGRLYDILSVRFGRTNVFMDFDTIQAGDDFAMVIEEGIGRCEVLLALIGERWLGSKREDGSRRLDETSDFVRLEIAKAFERGVRVVPVLLGRAVIPHPDSLPRDLQPLCTRQAVELRDGHFREDVDRLMRVLEETVPSVGSRTSRLRSRWFVSVGLAVLLIAPGAEFVLLGRHRPVSPEKATSGVGSVPLPEVRSAPSIGGAGPARNEPAKVSRSVDAGKPSDKVRSANIAGKWKGTVTYDWPNAVYPENFNFEVDGSEVSGTASHVEVECSIVNGKIDGNKLSFMTKTATELDDKIYHDKHSYKGTVEGNTIKFTLITDTDYQSHVPVHFTVTRVGGG